MKITIFLLVFSLYFYSNCIRANDSLFIKKDFQTKSLNDKFSFTGQVFTFNSTLKNIAFDPTRPLVLINIDENKQQYIVQFDLEAKSNWIIKNDASTAIYFDSTIYLWRLGKTELIRTLDGSLLWQQPFGHFLGFNGKNMLLSVKYNFLKPYDIILSDLKTEKKIWSFSTNSFTGLHDYSYNGVDLYLLLDGIHKINLKNGKSWFYPLKTASNPYKNLSFLGGYSAFRDITILSGDSEWAFGNYSAKNGFVSNICFGKDSNIFIADKENIVCLNNFNGSLIWSTKISQLNPTHSRIYDLGQNLFFVNFANYLDLGISYSSGKPFFAIIRKSDGEILKTDDLNKTKNISCYQLNDTISITLDDQLLTFNKQGSLKSILRLSKTETEKYGDIEYISPISNAKSLLINETSVVFNDHRVLCTKKGYLTLKNDSTIENFFGINQIGYIVYENSNYWFVNASNYTLSSNKILENALVIVNKTTQKTEDIIDITGYTRNIRNFIIYSTDDSFKYLKIE